MEFLWKALAVCLMAALGALCLRKSVPELAFCLQCVGVLIVLLSTFRILAPLFAFLGETASLLGTSGVYLRPVLKTVIIGVVTGIGASLCKDAGNSAAEKTLQLAGVSAALYAALPLLQLFVHTIGDLL